MTRNTLLLATASALAITLSVPALAADNTTQPKITAESKMTDKADANVAIVRPLFGTTVKAEELVGTDVKNFKGETVGEVESVLLDRSGRVRAVVVGVGGFLGMGEHDVAIDWQDLFVGDDANNVRIDMSEAALKELPEYEYSDESLRGKVFGDNRYRDYRRDKRAYDYSNDRPTDLRESVAADTLIDANGDMKASELIGMEIVGQQNKSVGEIEEILLAKDGQPTAAVGTGGVFGIGKRVVLVNWDKLSIHRNKDQVQIRTELSEADLKKLPERKTRD